MLELTLAVEKHGRIEAQRRAAIAQSANREAEIHQIEEQIVEEYRCAAIEERATAVDALLEKLAIAKKQRHPEQLRPAAIAAAVDHQAAIVCELLLRDWLVGIVGRDALGAPIVNGPTPWGGPALTRRWTSNDTAAAARLAAERGIGCATRKAMEGAVRAIAAAGKTLIPLQ